ncbi:hypothetical protein GLOIN_2v1770313 [Rhizophagus clarus]|uniref:Uncharacterized protein n=1 Tax=Rhizophagus clarus TaxID=94130 RepID=A0A8H3LK52_9GLOM|nr:hypothetical protein GLOIN_2v1770313 [Rhizophagus clarus]
MFVLNVDDYHNIHRRNQPTLSKTHDINHFVTILLNSNSNIPKIPFYSSNNISIHNSKDYIEYANILFAIFEKIEQEDYLNNFVISTICDRSGQINLRRAITLRLNEKDNSGIPSQILSLIPMIGSLHVSLNSREALF